IYRSQRPEPKAPVVTIPAPVDAPAAVDAAQEAFDGITEIQAMISSGRRDDAITALQHHSQLHPDNAYIPYLMGNLYFSKQWWTDGFEAYDAAIAKNPTYKTDPTLIKNVL